MGCYIVYCTSKIRQTLLVTLPHLVHVVHANEQLHFHMEIKLKPLQITSLRTKVLQGSILCFNFRDISGPEYRWSLKMGQRPISHSFTYKNQEFDGPFCILMGLLEKMMGPRILNRHLTAKLTSNLNSLYVGPNQKLKQI